MTKIADKPDRLLKSYEKSQKHAVRQVVLWVEGSPPPVGWRLEPWRHKGRVEVVAGYWRDLPTHQSDKASEHEYVTSRELAERINSTQQNVVRACRKETLIQGRWRIIKRPAPGIKNGWLYRAEMHRNWYSGNELAHILGTNYGVIRFAARKGYRALRRYYIERRKVRPDETRWSSDVRYAYRVCDHKPNPEEDK